MYFTPEEIFFYVLYNFYQVLIRDAPGISEKDENRSKSTKVTKVTVFNASARNAARKTADRRNGRSKFGDFSFKTNF